MKIIATIAKVVTTLAAIAGFVYIIATYGDKIVAWAKDTMAKFGCGCCGCECDDCECNCDGECTCDCECDDCDCCDCDCDGEECECECHCEEAAEEPAAEEADFEG